MKDRKLEIVIADDHRLVLDGFVKVLLDIEIVGNIFTAASGGEAYNLVRDKHIDMVITDLEMPGVGGIELLRKLKKDFPEIKVLVLTMHNNAALIREVIKLNADGYVLKSADKEELEQAILTIRAGKKYFEERVTLELVRTHDEMENDNVLKDLTEREKEILTLIAQGYSNKNIAEKLFIAAKTVDSHRTNLMQKLDIHNIAGLTRIAIKAKLI
jgi:DNA-binding NarL/FixJ family response regulator